MTKIEFYRNQHICSLYHSVETIRAIFRSCGRS